MKKTILKYLGFIFLASCSLTPVKGYLGAALPNDQISTLKIAGNRNFDTNIENINIDGVKLERNAYAITVLPGYHNLSFAWSFETAEEEDDKGLLASWKKSGNCRLAFSSEKERYYKIVVSVKHAGTWVSDPVVNASVMECDSSFNCKAELASENICIYTNRSPSGMIKIEL